MVSAGQVAGSTGQEDQVVSVWTECRLGGFCVDLPEFADQKAANVQVLSKKKKQCSAASTVSRHVGVSRAYVQAIEGRRFAQRRRTH